MLKVVSHEMHFATNGAWGPKNLLICPLGSAFYADYHHRLAKVMLVRFSLSKQAQDADRALRSLSKAVSSHVGDERRLLFLTTLSSCLLSRKAVSDESSEIECAIETLRRSIGKSPLLSTARDRSADCFKSQRKICSRIRVDLTG